MVARKIFVDAICLQVADYFLVSNKEGLLWVFSPHFIAGEGGEAAGRRVRLEEDIATLKAGEVILLGYSGA
jgi:hypothetical protein